jgi:hypothetical protein
MFQATHASWSPLIDFHFHDLMNQFSQLDLHLPTHLVVVDLCRSQCREQLSYWHKVLVD